MCRMIGLKNFDYRRHRRILENFFLLAEKGKVPPGDPPGHHDGWGIGWQRDGRAVVRKSGRPLVEEKGIFFSTLEEIGRSPVVIAHMRKSSWPDTSADQNAHPFSLGESFLAHNGTIRDYRKLLEEIPAPGRPHPQAIDSEVYFRYVLSRGSSGLGEAFRRAVRSIRKQNDYSSLTCLFSDGRRLYAFREYRSDPWYYTLYHVGLPGAEVICSQPVSPRLSWRMLSRGKLLVL